MKEREKSWRGEGSTGAKGDGVGAMKSDLPNRNDGMRKTWRICVCGGFALFLASLAAAAEPAKPAKPPAPISGDPVVLDSPVGGWTVAGLLADPDAQAVAYPPPYVDRGRQRGRTLVHGRIAGATPKLPGTIVVDGNAMPQYCGEDGRFVRPWAFGKGSNGVELRSVDGKTTRRAQFYEADPGRLPAAIRIVLGWNDAQAEVDLHVVTPDGGHAFWADPILENGGGLDVDSVDGAGPEIFSMVAPFHGPYQVWVNYWGNFGAEGYHFDEATREKDVVTATVTLIFGENTPDERRESFVVPMRKIGELTLVRSFEF